MILQSLTIEKSDIAKQPMGETNEFGVTDVATEDTCATDTCDESIKVTVHEGAIKSITCSPLEGMPGNYSNPRYHCILQK
mmetsp:Transcript_46892/g.99613  ORF Transcript_46892/g.99613 Transcript_46892/m.99613 type:complete len:80 (-) Transcript_46892:1091-1330(-)